MEPVMLTLEIPREAVPVLMQALDGLMASLSQAASAGQQAPAGQAQALPQMNEEEMALQAELEGLQPPMQ